MEFEDLGDAAIAAGRSLYDKAKKIGQEATDTSQTITKKVKPAFGKGLIELYAEAKDNIPKFGPPLEYGYIPQTPKSEIRITPQSNLTLEDIAKARAEQLANEAKLQNVYNALKESALLQGVNNTQRQTIAQPFAPQQLPIQVVPAMPMPANNLAPTIPIIAQQMTPTLAPQQLTPQQLSPLQAQLLSQQLATRLAQAQQLMQQQIQPQAQQLMQQQIQPQAQPQAQTIQTSAAQTPTSNNSPQTVFLYDDKTGSVSTILNEFPNAQEAEAEVNKLRSQGLPAYYAAKGYIDNLRLKA